MTRRLWLRTMTGALLSHGAQAQPWSLDGLPRYQPEHKLTGIIRNFGSSMGGLVKSWEQGFSTYQPGLRFEDTLVASDAAIGGLIHGADLAPSAREPAITDLIAFRETFNYDPTMITVGTGSYDVLGRSWGEVVFINRSNPISRLTMKQLDGIFGSERTGGWRGLVWSPEAARNATENIRTWGQLGLEGEWAEKEIQTYGYAQSGVRNFFELTVFHGGDKWNPNYREYVETAQKQVSDGEGGASITIRRMFEELANDPYGIAWAGIPQARGIPQVKALALAPGDGTSYAEPSKKSFQDRTYPLARSIYIFLNRAPGKPIPPKSKEFLRYILSREGQQELVRGQEYLPLTGELVRQQHLALE